MKTLSQFIKEDAGNFNKHNAVFGLAYETGTALHMHNLLSGSQKNKDPAHMARMDSINASHKAAIKKLPSHLKIRANSAAHKSAHAYVDSLHANHGIQSKDVKEIHHTYAGISSLIGRPAPQADNPHDIMVKMHDKHTKDFHGASLKATSGTASNTPVHAFDRKNAEDGFKSNIAGVWDKAKQKAGLGGKSNSQIKSVRHQPKMKAANAQAQKVAAFVHKKSFNMASLGSKKNHVKRMLRLKPEVSYDYVNGQKGTSIPVEHIEHNKLIHNAKTITATIAKTNSGNRVHFHDQDDNHLATVEHRTVHGSFGAPQANAKYGTVKPSWGDYKKLT